MQRGQNRIRRCCAICGSLLLFGFAAVTGPACAVKAAETQPAGTAQESTSDGWTKGQKIAGFLVLFTIACGGTAYLVMRPSLKKLKEAKQQTQETETQSDAQSESPEKTS